MLLISWVKVRSPLMEFTHNIETSCSFVATTITHFPRAMTKPSRIWVNILHGYRYNHKKRSSANTTHNKTMCMFYDTCNKNINVWESLKSRSGPRCSVYMDWKIVVFSNNPLLGPCLLFSIQTSHDDMVMQIWLRYGTIKAQGHIR